MRIKLMAVAAAALLFCGVAAGSPASAYTGPPGGSWDHIWSTEDSNGGGTIYVKEHGDVIELCDTAADGYAPRAEIAVDQGDHYELFYRLAATGGLYDCVTATATDGGLNHDLPEGVDIKLDFWLGPNPSTMPRSFAEHIYLNDH